MLRKVLLSGDMGRRFGQEHFFDVKNPAEALRALGANFKEFKPYLGRCAEKGLGFHVFIGEESIDESLLLAPAGKEVIRIVPALQGAMSSDGKGALFIIAAIALAVVTDGFSVGWTTAAGSTVMSASTIGSIAMALAVSGISMLMMKTPQLDRNEKAAPPYNFNGPVNTTAQGQAVPVVYGEMIVGSRVISAAITTQDIPVPPQWQRQL